TSVQPNCLNTKPAIPLISAVGRKTTTRVAVVASTASAISLTASTVACQVDLPMRWCRAIFSTSTIASSTKTPTTTAIANKVMVLIEKSAQDINAKVGIIDKGKAIAPIRVARQSR